MQYLEHSVALHFFAYNFITRHTTIRMSPALKAGVTDHMWSFMELVELIDRKRGAVALFAGIENQNQAVVVWLGIMLCPLCGLCGAILFPLTVIFVVMRLADREPKKAEKGNRESN